MLFNLSYTSTPVARIFEALELFLRQSNDDGQFGPRLFPAWFRPVLRRSVRTKEKFQQLHAELQRHESHEREKLYLLFLNHNKIERLCQNQAYTLIEDGDVHSNLYSRLDDLCDHLWSSTLTLKTFTNIVEDTLAEHYNRFMKENDIRVCSFCGLYQLASPNEGYREAYDHHLCKKDYPACSVNFKNLVPMCHHCNSSVKGSKNILFDENSHRTIAYYPYSNSSGVVIKSICTSLPSISDLDGTWSVKVSACDASDQDVVQSWKHTFRIEVRFTSRLTDRLCQWEKKLVADINSDDTTTTAELRIQLEERINKLKEYSYSRTEPNVLLEISYLEYLFEEADESKLSSLVKMIQVPYNASISQRTRILEI